MRNLPTAVLIHGCHLQAEGWEEIVWGNPIQGRLGRVPYGLEKAEEFDAQMIIFGTGASEKDGLKEGQYTFNYALAHLSDYALERSGPPHIATDVGAWLKKIARLELSSQNTLEEVRNAAKMANDAGIKRLILVSSPEHIMRCHQAALKVLAAEPAFTHFLDELYVCASHTHFAGAIVDDVVIIEPPHRGDMPKVPLNQTVKLIFGFLKDPQLAFQFDDTLKVLTADFKERQKHPVIFSGMHYFPKSERIRELVKDSLEPIQVSRENNAGRMGIRIRAVDPRDGRPRQMIIWDTGQEYDPIEPDSPAYGPHGEDTGW
jgi:hypothetical protein